MKDGLAAWVTALTASSLGEPSQVPAGAAWGATWVVAGHKLVVKVEIGRWVYVRIVCEEYGSERWSGLMTSPARLTECLNRIGIALATTDAAATINWVKADWAETCDLNWAAAKEASRESVMALRDWEHALASPGVAGVRFVNGWAVNTYEAMPGVVVTPVQVTGYDDPERHEVGWASHEVRLKAWSRAGAPVARSGTLAHWFCVCESSKHGEPEWVSWRAHKDPFVAYWSRDLAVVFSSNHKGWLAEYECQGRIQATFKTPVELAQFLEGFVTP